MRSAKRVANNRSVKEKLQSLQASLPKGVEIVPFYDRSALRARDR